MEPNFANARYTPQLPERLLAPSALQKAQALGYAQDGGFGAAPTRAGNDSAIELLCQQKQRLDWLVEAINNLEGRLYPLLPPPDVNTLSGIAPNAPPHESIVGAIYTHNNDISAVTERIGSLLARIQL